MSDEPRLITSLDIYSLGLVTHILGPRCVETSEQTPTCPGCGAGYITVASKESDD